ncbi:hypothetical protein SNE40_006249 [Patella caerulea]|uniref:Uncharacterized protein n=1 Tax=Patella caerulea TaxID=87958 RepID=A0AAN8K2X7_PATCE
MYAVLAVSFEDMFAVLAVSFEDMNDVLALHLKTFVMFWLVPLKTCMLYWLLPLTIYCEVYSRQALMEKIKFPCQKMSNSHTGSEMKCDTSAVNNLLRSCALQK